MPATTLELLTPCFCAGVDPTRPEIRAASIRGQLRFWTRILCGLGAAEYKLFGGIRGKAHGCSDEAIASAIILRVKVTTNLRPNSAPLCPHDPGKGNRSALPAGTRFEIRWFERFAPSPERIKSFRGILSTWELLGGLGARATRAAGSVWPLEYTPTVAEFVARLDSLGLPASVRVRVLEKLAPDSEALRKIATDTINRLGSGLFRGDPLGFVGGGRKVSPLKLKVGRFTDGFRLVAIADDRNGRGGDLKAAVQAMQRSNKELGQLLARANL